MSSNDLGLVELHRRNSFPMILVVQSISVLIPYLLYGYIRFLIFPLKKFDNRWFHFLPIVFMLINFLIPKVLGFPPIPFYMQTNIIVFSVPSLVPIEYILFGWLSLSFIYILNCVNLVWEGYKLTTENKINKELMLLGSLVVAIFLFVWLNTFFEATYNSYFKDSGTFSVLEKLLLIRPLLLCTLLMLFIKRPLMLNPKMLATKKIGFYSEEIWLEDAKINGASAPHRRFENSASILDLITEIEGFVTKNRSFKNPNYGLTELSKDLKIPENHLRFLFQNYSKLSFVEFRNYKRIEHLKDLIKNDKLPVHLTNDAVGELVGFGSPSAFIRAVRKYEHTTPQGLLN